MTALADSLWPRSGYDRGNRSRSPVAGPGLGRIVRRVALAAPDDHRAVNWKHGGIAVVPDGSLRVVAAGTLHDLSLDGERRWSRRLRASRSGDRYASAPLALADGDVVLTLARAVVRYDARGALRSRVASEVGMDDSGVSPNLTIEGALVTGSPIGDVLLLDANGWRSIDGLGYDVLPPAVYADGSLAVAGYVGKGLCRVDTDGHLRWRAAPRDADLPVTINQQQVAAVGSLNDRRSHFVGPDGAAIGTYAHAALFAEYPDGGWVALSQGRLARLASDGRERWARTVAARLIWSTSQPIVDVAGRVYATVANGVVCHDGDGREVFTTVTGTAQPQALSMVAEGLLACLVGPELLLLG